MPGHRLHRPRCTRRVSHRCKKEGYPSFHPNNRHVAVGHYTGLLEMGKEEKLLHLLRGKKSWSPRKKVEILTPLRKVLKWCKWTRQRQLTQAGGDFHYSRGSFLPRRLRAFQFWEDNRWFLTEPNRFGTEPGFHVVKRTVKLNWQTYSPVTFMA